LILGKERDKKVSLKKIVSAAFDCVLCVAAILALFVMVPVAKKTWFPPHDQVSNSGEPFRVPAQVTEKPTLVLGVSEHCGYCQKEVPVFQKLTNLPAYKQGKLDVLIYLPPTSDIDAANKWVAENNIPGHILTSQSAAEYSIDATPTLILLNKRKVARTWRGLMKSEEEKDFFDKLSSI
jgi:thiol-disulfide isomerase/thioredoxin